MKRGFTLFEVLLVLFVMSMIVVGGIQYANRKQEENAAKQLGHKLYQYGIAVAEYARLNPDNHAGDYEIYGYEWLKNTINPETCVDINDPSTCKMFLGKDFNLKLQALYIGGLHGDADGEDDKIFTKFIKDPATGDFTLDFIELGTVYRYSKDEKKYEVDLSLPGRAAIFANEFTDQYGGARILYAVQTFTGDNNVEDLHIVGLVNTSGPNVDAGFLRTDGSNQMNADVAFSASGDGVVFANGDKINAIRNVAMSGSLQFPDSSSDGNDGQLPAYRLADFYVYRKAKGKSWNTLNYNGKRLALHNSMCFLSGMQKPASGIDTCRVAYGVAAPQGYLGNDGLPAGNGDWIVFLNKETGSDNSTTACFARCLLFKE